MWSGCFRSASRSCSAVYTPVLSRMCGAVPRLGLTLIKPRILRGASVAGTPDQGTLSRCLYREHRKSTVTCLVLATVRGGFCHSRLREGGVADDQGNRDDTAGYSAAQCCWVSWSCSALPLCPRCFAGAGDLHGRDDRDSSAEMGGSRPGDPPLGLVFRRAAALAAGSERARLTVLTEEPNVMADPPKGGRLWRDRGKSFPGMRSGPALDGSLAAGRAPVLPDLYPVPRR
jgi:hypothetical protein